MVKNFKLNDPVADVADLSPMVVMNVFSNNQDQSYQDSFTYEHLLEDVKVGDLIWAVPPQFTRNFAQCKCKAFVWPAKVKYFCIPTHRKVEEQPRGEERKTHVTFYNENSV